MLWSYVEFVQYCTDIKMNKLQLFCQDFFWGIRLQWTQTTGMESGDLDESGRLHQNSLSSLSTNSVNSRLWYVLPPIILFTKLWFVQQEIETRSPSLLFCYVIACSSNTKEYIGKVLLCFHSGCSPFEVFVFHFCLFTVTSQKVLQFSPTVEVVSIHNRKWKMLQLEGSFPSITAVCCQ